MRLSQLRQRMMIAIGLPACATPTGPPPHEEPVVVASPTPRDAGLDAAPVPVVVFDRTACKVDETVETLCGISDGPWCGPTAEAMDIDHGTSDAPISHGKPRALRHEFTPDGEAQARALAKLGKHRHDVCCYAHCTALSIGIGNAGGRPPGWPRDGGWDETITECIVAPPAGTSQPAAANPACPIGVTLDGTTRPYASGTTSTCCYAQIIHMTKGGRPARLDGEPRFATVVTGSAWRTELCVDVAALAPPVRSRLAAAWLATARMEHASIAAFATTTLRLLALGAPPELIAGAHAAGLDEIRHAQLAFGLASTYAGEPIAPGRFAAAAELTATGGLAELARETFVDGCIGEAVAALSASRAAERARDPVIGEALRQLAADEARHADLAWAIVAWCVRAEPGLAAELERTLASLPEPIDEPHELHDLASHGVIGTRAAHGDVVREVVRPGLLALAA